MPLLLDWRSAGQPADAVRPVAEALRQGGLAVLPTESGYVIAASGNHEEARARLASEANPLTILVAQSSQLGKLSLRQSRILSRLWPGPLGVEWGTRYWSPSFSAVQVLLQECDFPIVVREEPQATESIVGVTEKWGDRLAVIVDAGALNIKPLNWVKFESDGWTAHKSPAVQTDLLNAAAEWIVFVCTGNTCRSPMAEALFKRGLAVRLDCPIAELPSKGYQVRSAGVAAFAGDGPSPEAVEVLKPLDANLEAHRSQALSIDMAAQADHLIAMTRSHLLAVLTRFPVIGGTMRLLCGCEGDLEDPIGGPTEVYAQCAQTIHRQVDRLLRELVR